MKYKYSVLGIVVIVPSIWFIVRYFNSFEKFGAASEMIVQASFLKYFTIDPVSTEYNAYVELSKKPLHAPIHYYAIPWALLINSNNLDKVPACNANPGFTVCQHIDFEKIIPLLQQRGIDTLFTPHVIKGKQYPIRVLPFPHYAVNGIGPAQEKDIFYSFIGSDTHPTRQQLFSMQHPDDAVVIKRGIWHFASREKEHEKAEYQDVLARSRFSLCPRGTGAGTIRFWESLEAGAIPVMIGHDMWFPEPFDWDSCVIVIDEHDIEQIPNTLRAVSAQKEAGMRKCCMEAYRNFSGENLVSTVRYLYEK